MKFKIFALSFLIIFLFNLLIVQPITTFLNINYSTWSIGWWAIVFLEIPLWNFVESQVQKMLEK